MPSLAFHCRSISVPQLKLGVCIKISSTGSGGWTRDGGGAVLCDLTIILHRQSLRSTN